MHLEVLVEDLSGSIALGIILEKILGKNDSEHSSKVPVLDSYEQDSICGTWERLADAVHPGGSMRLKRAGWPEAGKAKCEWAGRIAPYMDPDRNRSKSFQVFRDGIRSLAEA